MLNSEDVRKWEDAIQEEYDSLMTNRTCKLTNLPKDRKNVGCKWVFHTKRDASRDIVRHKAWLITKDFLKWPK